MAEQLQRPYIRLYKSEWDFLANEVEFNLPDGTWVKLLLGHSFVIARFLELGASPESMS